MSDSMIHAVAGAAGGVVAMSLTYPLIFFSTRAAVETKNSHRTTLEVLKKVLREEGVTGIYSGLTSSLLGIAVANGIYYYYYELTKSAITKGRGSKALSTLESMLTGLVAGASTTIISNPIWVIQTTQAVRTASAPSGAATEGSEGKKQEKKKTAGMIQTAMEIANKDGLQAFWRGVGPALVLVINPILQYTAFEQLKNLIVARRQVILRARGSAQAAGLTDWDFFWLGAVSKLFATSATYPYIVLKSRQQSGTQASTQKSSLHALLKILQDEGVRGLYRGMGSKLLQSVLTAAILFVGQRRIYVLTKEALAGITASKSK
ncbi:peroxisomal membrane protein [Dacryopinax primogenitus]|uniref:Peroxisomal membrane protein n=1 Tax=Dacryopinax primogenitus (strain DJM 731) TaxID=1858805 RepID=M5FVX8_DACPD|nr:peroxisomal membrane protein [Dacryopinax primogenitus]EJT97516.1 peroxisomal membrane protein [Dacryopinax primogenitus]